MLTATLKKEAVPVSRQKVLELLRSCPEEHLSGEEIAQRLGLSRAAVWKAVDALRRDGYTVEAKPGLGYRLTAAPDALTEPEIRGFLGETAVARLLQLIEGKCSRPLKLEVSTTLIKRKSVFIREKL